MLLKRIFHNQLNKELFLVNSFKIEKSSYMFDMLFDEKENKLIFDFSLNIFEILEYIDKDFSIYNSFVKEDIILLNSNSSLDLLISSKNFKFSPLLKSSIKGNMINSINLKRLIPMT